MIVRDKVMHREQKEKKKRIIKENKKYESPKKKYEKIVIPQGIHT